jgi:hypothetical protein
MKYAVFDTAGFPTAFYAPEVHGDAIPAEAVEITDAQWLELVEHQGTRKWVDGAVVAYEPPPAPPAVPQDVSRAQAKIALSRAGLLSSVEQRVAAAGGEVAIWFADALRWKRDNPYVASLGSSLGLTPEAIDDLFRQAAQIAE